jgi:hypothetical protein
MGRWMKKRGKGERIRGVKGKGERYGNKELFKKLLIFINLSPALRAYPFTADAPLGETPWR